MTTSVVAMTPRSSFRSFLITAGACALAASTFASCGSSSDDAITMNGKSTNNSDVKKLAAAIIEDQVVEPVKNDISGSDMRILLTWLIQNQAADEFFATVGESITEADKQATIDNDKTNFDGLTKLTSDFFAVHQSIGAVWDRIDTPGESAVKALYEKSPALSGSLCLRHILVKTEKEAKDVVSKLKNGASFADLAKSTSIDTGSGARGGSLGSTETNDCLTNSTILEKFDAQFNAGALKAKIGTVSDPVKTQFGWHIIIHRPWSEVKDSVMENLTERPGREMYFGYLMTSKISVNPKYGKWDPISLSVINPKATTDTTAPADTSGGAGETTDSSAGQE